MGKKKPQVANAAVARELCGFVWNIGRAVQPHPKKSDAKASGRTTRQSKTPTSLADVSSRGSSPKG